MLMTAALCQADPVQLVTNGGFETGNFSGWTVSGNTTYCMFVGSANDSRCLPSTTYGGQSGNYAAELGNDTYDASLSQTIATTGNGTYDVSFWLASQTYGAPADHFEVTWGAQTLMNDYNLGAFGYTQFDFSGLDAAGPTTVLTFSFYNSPAYFALDNVSVVDPPRMPEPAPFAAFGLLSALPLCYALRRRSPQCGGVRS